MPTRTSTTGSELFIVDNSNDDWKVLRYLHDWCQIAKSIDIATGYFEIGSLLALKAEWQKLDKIRILLGDEVSMHTQATFNAGLTTITSALNESIESEKQKNDFLTGVPAIVEAIRSKKIECRVYRRDKFHAKAYITHARLEVVGASALVGSSNFTCPGLTENLELNVQITGGPVKVLQEWYEDHWNKAEDVTPDVLRVIERHTRDYIPFDIYAKSLFELFRDAAPSEQVWEETRSRLFHVLDGYQQDGYHNLKRIANEYGGALLCDGVGLGKTFVGLMLIEHLIVRDGRNVILLAPKGALESVWKPALKRRLPQLFGGAFSNLFVAAHTDLGREKTRELFEAAKERAHAIVIDEAHHFRNPGSAGTGVAFLEAPKVAQQASLFTQSKRSRYRELFDLVPSPDGKNKQIFALTATPINNSFHDLRHIIQLFTQRNEDHFGQKLGIYSLTAHFKRMEQKLDTATDAPALTDSEEAKDIMKGDPLVTALVVQRSRAFVKEKQRKAGVPITAFPPRLPPQRVDYSLKKVYGKLLEKLEKAFDKQTPLFTLPMYYPLAYLTADDHNIDPGDENRQKQVVALIRTGFLKRFESSVEAFRSSCERLLARLLAWATAHAHMPEEKADLEEWCQTNIKLVDAVKQHHPEYFGQSAGEEPDSDEADEDIFEEEFLEAYDKLPRTKYNIGKMLAETLADLRQLADFFPELDKFDHRNDDKLKSLIKLLNEDPDLSTDKVIIFSEFSDTADYLLERLTAAKIEGLERIDSRTTGRDRLAVIRRFSPYYNSFTSAQLAQRKEQEIRVLISTDVLSEGLNLQDASRLVNYDLHWNPVRLMQRIGRVDRRRDPEIENALAADHPDTIELRKVIRYYNFLPPAELNRLLTLYSRVTRKTLRISKALGIEGKKLLTQDDDYQDLQHFNESYEGTKSAMELLELERDELFKNDPDLKVRLAAMPLRVFSGRSAPGSAGGDGYPVASPSGSPFVAAGMSGGNTRAVFFCFRLPSFKDDQWTTETGACRWILYPLGTAQMIEDPISIADYIRSTPETPRKLAISQEMLAHIRGKIEKHLKNTYLKSVQAPVGVKPALVAWMELN